MQILRQTNLEALKLAMNIGPEKTLKILEEKQNNTNSEKDDSGPNRPVTPIKDPGGPNNK